MQLQMPDILGNYMAGRQARREVDKQNFLSQAGGALMNGDPRALEAYAKVDPMGAMNLMQMRQQQAMQQQQMQMQQERLGMERERLDLSAEGQKAQLGMERERLEMARENGRRAAAQYAEQMSAAEAAQTSQALKEAASAALMVKTPEQFERVKGAVQSRYPDADLSSITFEDREAAAASIIGVSDVLDVRAANADGLTDSVRMIMQTTDPDTGLPYTKEKAIEVKELRSTSHHPLSGRLQVVHKGTGEEIGGRQKQQLDLPDEEVLTGDEAGNIPGAFGAWGKGAAFFNALTDTFGLPMTADEIAKAQTYIKNLGTTFMLTMQGDLEGKPSNLTREKMEELTASVEWTSGPETALNKSREVRRHIGQTMRNAGAIYNDETDGYTPAQRARALETIQRLRPLYEKYSVVIEALEGKAEAAMTPKQAEIVKKLEALE